MKTTFRGCLALAGIALGCGNATGGTSAVQGSAVADGAEDCGERGGDLWQTLFGPNDPELPGRSCFSRRDDCRGSTQAWVCASDAGQQVGDGLTCRRCTSDAQCGWEYFYWNSSPGGSSVQCGQDGLCHPVPGADTSYCQPRTGYCRTAQRGWYVCGAPNSCELCTSDEQCRAEYPGDSVCMTSGASRGQCIDVPPKQP
jgi:hypothetical protein